MRTANPTCVLSILLSLSPIRNVHRRSGVVAFGGFPMVFAAAAAAAADSGAAATAAIARGIPRNGNRGDRRSCRGVGERNQLCLRPLTARSGFYLKTLRRRRLDRREEDGRDGDEPHSNTVDACFCWESVEDAEPAPPEHEPAATLAVATFRLPSSAVQRPDKQQRANGNAIGPRSSLARKIELLFATTKVRNNEIPLPRSIAELFQREAKAAAKATAAAPTRDDPGAMERSLGAGVDLTGRWKPSGTLSAQDLSDYDEFLKACCSDKISYWTRKLVASSSIVSRQEFLVTQWHGGRIVEFVDSHPLAPNAWNRTIVTSDAASDGGDRPYPNRLNGPRGDPVLIEAYWQKNGTVLTSFLRNDDNDGDSIANEGWVQTRRYLHSEDEAQTNRVMVVETIYHPTPFRTETESKKRNNAETPGERGDGAAATRMVWKWEQVIE